jgi:hypothetical protein
MGLGTEVWKLIDLQVCVCVGGGGRGGGVAGARRGLLWRGVFCWELEAQPPSLQRSGRSECRWGTWMAWRSPCTGSSAACCAYTYTRCDMQQGAPRLGAWVEVSAVAGAGGGGGAGCRASCKEAVGPWLLSSKHIQGTVFCKAQHQTRRHAQEGRVQGGS